MLAIDPYPEIPCKGFLGHLCSRNYLHLVLALRVVPPISHQRIASAKPRWEQILAIDLSTSQNTVFSIDSKCTPRPFAVSSWSFQAHSPWCCGHFSITTSLPPMWNTWAGDHFAKAWKSALQVLLRQSSSLLVTVAGEKKTLLWSNSSHLEKDR